MDNGYIRDKVNGDLGWGIAGRDSCGSGSLGYTDGYVWEVPVGDGGG